MKQSQHVAAWLAQTHRHNAREYLREARQLQGEDRQTVIDYAKQARADSKRFYRIARQHT